MKLLIQAVISVCLAGFMTAVLAEEPIIEKGKTREYETRDNKGSVPSHGRLTEAVKVVSMYPQSGSEWTIIHVEPQANIVSCGGYSSIVLLKSNNHHDLLYRILHEAMKNKEEVKVETEKCDTQNERAILDGVQYRP